VEREWRGKVDGLSEGGRVGKRKALNILRSVAGKSP
jgi:hypothetical protein